MARVVIPSILIFIFRENSVGPIKQSYRALFGDTWWTGEPTRGHRWHYKITLFSEATFIIKFEFTAWVVRSSAYVPFIPLQLSWEPTPFWSLRVPLDTSCRVALVVQTDASLSSYPSRRVAFSVRYVVNTRRVMQGLARSLRPHSHCKAIGAEQNRTDPTGSAWKRNRYEMAAFTVNAERSRIEPNQAGLSSTYVLCIPPQASWQPTPFWSLRVALGTSCCVALVVRTGASLSSYPSRRVAFSARCVLNKWRVVQRLARNIRLHSHCKASRSEQNRTNPIPMENKHSQFTPNRIKPNRVRPSSTYVLCIPPQASWQPNPF